MNSHSSHVGFFEGCQNCDREKREAAEYGRLIAAAPQMLEALRILTEHAQEKYPHFESERGQKDISAALAAIQAAVGKG